MRDKKKTAPEKTPEQEELEKHVDAMMDPKQPDETPAGPATKEPEIAAVAAPVSEGPTTAPQLPKPRKQITIVEADTHKKPKKTKNKATAPDKPEASMPPDADKQVPGTDITENDVELDDSQLDDAQTDKAVDDIVAYEGDVMLAVADSTAEARNRQFTEAEPEEHHLFSTVMWMLVALVAILIIALSILLVMGDSLAGKLGL